ncbi:MAG: sn-glycerol-3-phosphate ABC transporter ATP-binding protein UgpC [Rhodospirillales bacterium]|nr:sn-glycerol-3-phosphate ABC transporter ATP-binding protein UgpC [Rhodospirillales bacterium]
MASVEIKNVYKSFGPVEVIHGIDVEIADKELVVLVGPSGCGKSTLLRMIAGLEDITAGEISIGGKVVNRVAAKDRNIAMVFQSYALYPHMTVYRNMSFGLRMRKIAKDEQDRRIKWAAEILELTDYLKRYPRQLSGGQRQRVAMGRALVREPIAFLFDEPLSNLDAQLRVQMRTEIRELHQRLQTTMIYVTHDQVEAMTLADRIVVMRDGYIEQIGTPEHVYDRPANTFVAGFIGSPQMNMLPGTLGPDGTIALEGGVTVRHAQSLEAQSGRSVLYGIRPEDLQLVGEGEGLTLNVDVVETTGREIELFGNLGSRRICVLLQARASVRPGDTVRISPAPERAHVFDAESGVRLDAAGEA